MSIKECWGTTTEQASTNGQKLLPVEPSTIFYKDMCPKFSWVSHVTDEHASNAEKRTLDLSQFALIKTDGSSAVLEIYYHCEVNLKT